MVASSRTFPQNFFMRFLSPAPWDYQRTATEKSCEQSPFLRLSICSRGYLLSTHPPLTALCTALPTMFTAPILTRYPILPLHSHRLASCPPFPNDSTTVFLTKLMSPYLLPLFAYYCQASRLCCSYVILTFVRVCSIPVSLTQPSSSAHSSLSSFTTSHTVFITAR